MSLSLYEAFLNRVNEKIRYLGSLSLKNVDDIIIQYKRMLHDIENDYVDNDSESESGVFYNTRVYDYRNFEISTWRQYDGAIGGSITAWGRNGHLLEDTRIDENQVSVDGRIVLSGFCRIEIYRPYYFSLEDCCRVYHSREDVLSECKRIVDYVLVRDYHD